jgi:hypothetical protein
MHFMLFISSLCHIIITIVNIAHAQPSRDGTLSYFNDRYTSKDPFRYEISMRENRDDSGRMEYRAYIIAESLSSDIMMNKHDATVSVIQKFLRKVEGNSNRLVLEAAQYNTKLLMEDLQLTFGRPSGFEESEHIELKSHRVIPEESPNEPYSARQLQTHIVKYTTKYAAGFLNAQLFSKKPIAEATLYFGIHDDGIVDGHILNTEDRDVAERLLHEELDKIANQNFDRNLEWHTVYSDDYPNVWVLSIGVSPLRTRKDVFAVQKYQKEVSFMFWIKKGTMCKTMTIGEVEKAYHITAL